MVKLFLLSTLLVFTAVFTVAAEQPVLTVYTNSAFTSDWGPGAAIKKTFEAECDCQLKWVPLNDSVSLLNRLRMEGKNSPADVVLGLDNNLLQTAQQTGLFATSQIDSSVLNLPTPWKNKTFVPYDYGYFAFIYHKDKVKNPPKSLRQLVESTTPWTVIYQDPRTSTPGLGLLLWMQKVYGAQAPQAWQKLAQKTVTVTRGWNEAYGLFLKGEGDFVLSYTTSPAYHSIEEKNDHYAAADFGEGHYLQVEVAAQLAASKHPKLAQRFMHFILTPAFQQHIPTGNWMYPMIKMDLPTGFNHLTVPKKALQYDAKEVAENRNTWIQLWQNAVSR
ncbi:thiamine ABC transporter substrate binding subunit [Candidatus Fukatsuia symbiotica]|uniref:thiamine ABC transporter substrate binding subunit n=1 Tax=Candidatus Fukatsuia TaxID=1927833 RepID=UPI000A96C3AE|nr:thiamine ABC transporter substrate binding subunit [Candidatus Fukatsuia symbiotica]MEA9445761.1 thiamine ABC transporter substrate binding subunit [Candidatus Fukatsuia symbiotica]